MPSTCALPRMSCQPMNGRTRFPSSSSIVVTAPWVDIATAAMSSLATPDRATALRQDSKSAGRMSSGVCSTHPGRG